MLTLAYLCFTASAGAVEFTPPFDVNAKSVYFINLDTKSVIYEKNADLEQMPASLVNIMTAVIVLENCKDPDNITKNFMRNLRNTNIRMISDTEKYGTVTN